MRRGLFGLILVACLAAGPATHPATAPADPELWRRLVQIDARAAQVKTLAADFRQEKFTALMRKPLVSSGTVRVKGAQMRWDTVKPEPNVLAIDASEARIYYPAQKVLEVYPLDQRLGELAASPLPRLEVLKQRFSFEEIAISDLEKSGDPKRFIALKLTPTDPSLAEHVKQVRVLLDVQNGYIVRAEVTDSDADRTAISFSNVRLNADVGDLALAVPAGTKVTHPLEGLGDSPTSRGK